jgi:hypothetical protein
METMNNPVRVEYQPCSFMEFLLGDGIRQGCLDRLSDQTSGEAAPGFPSHYPEDNRKKGTDAAQEDRDQSAVCGRSRAFSWQQVVFLSHPALVLEGAAS